MNLLELGQWSSIHGQTLLLFFHVSKKEHRCPRTGLTPTPLPSSHPQVYKNVIKGLFNEKKSWGSRYLRWGDGRWVRGGSRSCPQAPVRKTGAKYIYCVSVRITFLFYKPCLLWAHLVAPIFPLVFQHSKVVKDIYCIIIVFHRNKITNY